MKYENDYCAICGKFCNFCDWCHKNPIKEFIHVIEDPDSHGKPRAHFHAVCRDCAQPTSRLYRTLRQDLRFTESQIKVTNGKVFRALRKEHNEAYKNYLIVTEVMDI